MEFFLVVFVICLIVLVFVFTFMVINQSFIEKRNQQLENYKATFKEVPKLLKVKIVFQEGTSTMVLPEDVLDSKLTTVFVNAPKGTKITFSPSPGAPMDVYEKVGGTDGVLSGVDSRMGRIFFSQASFDTVNWTKNGVPINDEELNKIIIPREVPITVESKEEFKVNIEKKIETIDVLLAKEVALVDSNRLEDVNIISSVFDANDSYVGTRIIVIDHNDFDKNIRTIVVDSNTSLIDSNTTNTQTDFNVYDRNNSVVVSTSDECSSEDGAVCGETIPATCAISTAGSINSSCRELAVKKTYSNLCELESAGASFLYKGECVNCLTQGTGINSTSAGCCSGLTVIPYSYTSTTGSIVVTSYQVCSNCGNSVCESWESSSTCSSDCNSATTSTTTDTNNATDTNNSAGTISTCTCLTNENNPTCGIDGNTYSSPCFAYCKSGQIAYAGACIANVNYCGGVSNKSCPVNYFCQYDYNYSYSTGKCIASTTSSGSTNNTCGCSVVSGSTASVCGIDGNTYSSPCFASCHGTSVGYIGNCISGVSYCGGVSNKSCPVNYFCQHDYNYSYSTGKCIASINSGASGGTSGSNTCSSCNTTELTPTCGNDGNTYPTPCLAYCKGVQPIYKGSCIAGTIYCGGSTNLACPSGFSCLKDYNYSYSTGRCVTATISSGS
ncbi:MAG: Kazal-type serine protease inhibitor domain-containing protein [archaeon]|jgi:hypothetical protein